MTNSQNVANFGFNPPQNNSQTIKINIPDDSKQTNFANLCTEPSKNGLKQVKNEAKKDPLQAGNEKVTFWTACSYCYYMHEYEKKFEECCLRCQNCRNPFHAMPMSEGLSVKGYCGNSSVVVEISDSDDDDDEKKEKKVKAQGFNDGEERVVNVMTDKFSFSQNVTNFGFNPPQNNAQTINKNHFLNRGSDGNEFKSRKNVVKKGPLEAGNEKGTFWTSCSYCYYKYEYDKKYEECCIRCQNCRKAFHAVAMAGRAKGLSVKGRSRNSSTSEKKAVRRQNTAKRHDVVEISDSDDEKKERVMKRVKSVARATKKIAGRGVKTKKVENEVADGCNEDELEFFEGVDDIFVDLRDI